MHKLFSLVLALTLASAAHAQLALESESVGIGDGVERSRTNASNDKTTWLQAGEQREFELVSEDAVTYAVGCRYSNDNFGPLETIEVLFDGFSLGAFSANDTGNFGLGWNVFKPCPSLANIVVNPGTPHRLTVRVSGGDGWGVELDVVTLEPVAGPPPTAVRIEAEDGSGDGEVQSRTEASQDETVLLQANESQWFSGVVSPGRYEVRARYSNDNFGPTETIQLFLNGISVGGFAALDTGNYGHGWNSFEPSPVIAVVDIGGSALFEIRISGGDGWGVEMDYLQLDPIAQ
jgi:hypothetical protein